MATDVPPGPKQAAPLWIREGSRVTTIYAIEDAGEDGSAYVGTLAEAKTLARSVANAAGLRIEVRRHTLVAGSARAVALALLNGGWSAKSEVVWTAIPRARP
jgi:hypothetical protein